MPEIEPLPGVAIVNPAAGRRRRSLEDLTFEGGVLKTEYPGHATELAREAALRHSLVIAAGGDGTVGEVATGLIGTDATLGILPLGTGNDFARMVGSTGEILRTGVDASCDAIRWSCGARTGFSLNIAGCGFDAVVADRINRGFRQLSGTTAYVVGVLDTLRTYRPAPIRLTVDGQSLETTVTLCAIANARYYGGGMKIAPDAQIDDGLLDVVLVEGVGRAEFLRAFPRVFKGTHLSHPKVRFLRGRRVRLETEPSLPVMSDGELIGTSPAEFEIVPSALRVRRSRQA